MNFENKLATLSELNGRKQLVVVNKKFKTVYFNFDVDGGLPNHCHNGYASIQVLEGTIKMNFDNGETYQLEAGQILSFDARISHDVIAKTKSKVLVTISEVL